MVDGALASERSQLASLVTRQRSEIDLLRGRPAGWLRRFWNWLAAVPGDVETVRRTVTQSLVEAYWQQGNSSGWAEGAKTERQRILAEIDEWIRAYSVTFQASVVDGKPAGEVDFYRSMVQSLKQIRGEIEVVIK